jgi:F0F1-type ATP synthase assembly protein I
MQPFDEDYLARREKQIHEMFELRAMIGACLVTGVMVGLIGAVLLSAGYGTAGAILLVVALLFGMGSIFMAADYSAKKAADRAIQKEYEHLALYGLPEAKAKRRGQGTIRLADDGEMAVEHGAEGEASYRETRDE